MRNLLLMAMALPGALATTTASAAILFESGTLGPTGIYINEIGGGTEPGGAVISDFVFNGARFELTQAAITSRVGGHFVADPRFADTFFGAIVRLDHAMDFPDSGNLSTPDLLGTTLLAFPNPSAEVFGDLELQLDPGWYALVFGSGLYGAAGRGGALLNNPDIGSPTYFGHQPSPGWFEISPPNGPFHNFRLIVEGNFVPEPNAGTIVIATSLFGMFGTGRRTARRNR